MPASFELAITDPFGTPLFPLTSIYSLSYGRTVNAVGEGTLIVPAVAYDFNTFQPWQRLLVQRALPGLTPYIDLHTCWFILGLHDQFSLDGQTMYQFDLVDTTYILGGPVLPYQQGNPTMDKLLATDDMLKQLVSENLGAGATDTARSIATYMTIEANQTKAPVVHHQFRNENLLTQMQEVANESYLYGTYLAFDIELTDPQSGSLTFRTFTGQRGIDHRFPSGTNPLILDVQSGNLANSDFATDYTNLRNMAYVGGQGTLGLKPIQAVGPRTETTGLGPFARREVWVNNASSDDPAALTAAGNAELRKDRPAVTLTARIVEQANSLRGVHWDWGDLVTGNFKKQMYDFILEKIVVNLRASDQDIMETVDVQMRSLA